MTYFKRLKQCELNHTSRTILFFLTPLIMALPLALMTQDHIVLGGALSLVGIIAFIMNKLIG